MIMEHMFRFLPALDDSVINPEMQMETVNRDTVDYRRVVIP